jgi:hypothetical protein
MDRQVVAQDWIDTLRTELDDRISEGFRSMSITTLEQLEGLVEDAVVILVQRDPTVKMASVSVAAQGFMSGNYWDFKPECHGGFHYELAALHGRWASAQGLTDILATFLTTKGAKSEKIIEETYDWATQSVNRQEAAA